MIFPGHLGAGFLTTYVTLTLTGASSTLSVSQFDTLLIVGTLLGVAPDVDILFYFLHKKTLRPAQLSAHRQYVTHAPLLWLLAGISTYALSSVLHAGILWQSIGLLMWLCPWSHFIFDSIDCGIMWFWPITKRQFALYNSQEQQNIKKIPGHTHWRHLFVGYLKNPLVYIEIAVATIAIYSAWFIVK